MAAKATRILEEFEGELAKMEHAIWYAPGMAPPYLDIDALITFGHELQSTRKSAQWLLARAKEAEELIGITATHEDSQSAWWELDQETRDKYWEKLRKQRNSTFVSPSIHPRGLKH